ncbi:MAG: hypothetical protein ACRBM6_31935 [Geminicoccales bacterium]
MSIFLDGGAVGDPSARQMGSEDNLFFLQCDLFQDDARTNFLGYLPDRLR